MLARGDEVGVFLSFKIDGNTTEFFSNLTVDEYSTYVHNFLSKVSDFYEKYVDELPLTLVRIKKYNRLEIFYNNIFRWQGVYRKITAPSSGCWCGFLNFSLFLLSFVMCGCV